MTKAAATLEEEIIRRLEELKSGIQRNELHIARLEQKIDGEKSQIIRSQEQKSRLETRLGSYVTESRNYKQKVFYEKPPAI